MRRLSALLAAATLAACSHDDPGPPTPPGAPTGLHAHSPIPGALRAWWAAVPGATSYAVYRAQGAIDPATAQRSEVPTAEMPTWTASGYAPGSSWNVAVAAIGAGGEGGRSADLAVDVRPLAEITAAVTTSTTASLAWTPVSDGTYVLYRSPVSPVDPATATAIPTAVAEVVDAVEPGATYFYAVAAVYDGAESPLGPERTVTTPPAAPAWLDVTAPAPGTLRLTWAAVAAATGYTALCGPAPELPDAATATAATTATTVDVIGLADGTAYYCAVRAESDAGVGDLSPLRWAPTLPAAPSPTAVAIVGGASLTWPPVAGAIAYVVWWAQGTGEVVEAATACTADACTWSQSGLGDGVVLHLSVQARNAANDAGPASATIDVTTLLAPPALTATAGDGAVTLAWTDPNSPAAATYDLYWSDAGPVTLASARVAGVASPYVHAVPALGRTYRYAIVAVGAASSSPLSAEATALVARTGRLATAVAPGVTTFGQSIPAAPGGGEHFPGQAGYWDLQQDLSIASGGYDGPFLGAHVLQVGRLATSPPTFDSLVAEYAALDFFPFDQTWGELSFFAPLFGATDGVAIAATSDGSTLDLPPLSGARSAYLNATSDSRLQHALDLTGVAAATIGWKQRVWAQDGRIPGDAASFAAALRLPDGTLLETLAPACSPSADLEQCTATVGAAALGQPVVLSFELRAAAPGLAELDDVVVTGGPALADGDFEADGGWTTNPGAEAQNVTSGRRTLCVDGPFASPCPTPLVVTRSFFTAPASAWARVVDVFENPGAAEVTADVVYLTVTAAGPTTVAYDPGGLGNAVAAYDASPTPARDFGLVLGDAAPYYRSASPDGTVPGEGMVFAVRTIAVPPGGRVALAAFLVMDGARSHVGGGTAATGIEQVAAAIADGFAAPADSTWRDWLAQEQLDAIVNF